MPHFSIFSWFGFPIAMEDRFKMIKAAGFDGVLLWWSDDNSEVDGDKVLQPELARSHGLFIENIHTPFEGINCLWEEGAAGDDFEKKLAGCIDDCFQYQIPTAVIHVSQGNNPPPPGQIGLNHYKRLVELAERKNINIALENTRKPEYLEFLFKNIQSDRLGFCYDSGHENCYTKGTDLLSQYGPKLKALHLHDNDGTDDQHLLPGEGTVDWSELNKKLKATGYTGAIAMEIKNTHGGLEETPEAFLKRAFAAAQKWLGEEVS